MDPEACERASDLIEVDRVHRDDELGRVVPQVLRPDDPVPGAGDELAVLVRVDVDGDVDVVPRAGGGQERDALRAAAPDHGAAAALPHARELCTPALDLRGDRLPEALRGLRDLRGLLLERQRLALAGPRLDDDVLAVVGELEV